MYSYYGRLANPPSATTNVTPGNVSNKKPVDDEPTQRAVADRFSMWEKKAGDALGPLRQATPIHGNKASTPAAAKTAGSASASFVSASYL